MAPNHGGDPLGSILEPMGSHWVKKMGQNVENYHASKFEFSTTPQSSIFSKNESLGYSTKSQWGLPRVHLGANGVPLGPKSGSKRRKLPCPKIRIDDAPAVINFSPKMEVTVMARNNGGDSLVSILGPMGSHWVQKKGQNRKILPCRKIRIFDNPAVIDFSQKMEVTVMVPNHGGDPLWSILGPMGSHWVQKLGQSVEYYHAPKFHFRRPRGHRFFPKNWSYVYGVKSRWGPPRVHLGANGVPFGPKNVWNCWKLQCPKIRIFDYPAVINFSPKLEITVIARNHSGDPLGSILGPMGFHWVKKWVKTVKNYHAAKFKFSTTPQSSIFPKKWKLRL